MARYKVSPIDGVNLRRTPEALADLSNREDTLLFGTEFDAAPVKGKPDWLQLAVERTVGGVRTARSPLTVYAMARYCADITPTTPPPTPTPAPATSFRLGLNVMQNTHLAQAEAARGCSYFLIMNDYGGAEGLAVNNPDKTIMARRYIEHRGGITVDQMINLMEGARHRRLVYHGLNENDQLSDRGADLVERARFDAEVAKRVQQLNADKPEAERPRYAAGTFSVGCPDFTNPETVRIIKEIYAPAYNAGLLAFDMHLYSPNMANVDKPAEWKWYERRWEWLFTACGFNPAIRAIYCSECGVDEMGVGGFVAHKATSDQVLDWSRKYIDIQQQPLIVNGVKYASPIIGGAIFQLGGNGDPRWGGYEMNGYLPAVRQVYQGARSISRRVGVRKTGRAKG